MRGILFVAFATAGAAVYACDSFEESNPPVVEDAGIEETSAPDSPPSPPADVETPCDGEPEWAYPTGPVPTTATCAGLAGLNLLTSAEHCGRCGHSCGADGSCKDGLCEPKQVDTLLSVPMRVADGVLYYAHRVPGMTDEVMRIAPGSEPVVLGKNDPDGGANSEIVSMVPAQDGLYVRTKGLLLRTDKAQANNAAPALVAALTGEETSYVLLAPDGRLVVSARSQSRYDVVTTNGDVSTFLANAEFPFEAAFAGDRFVWMSQPFFYFSGTGSSYLRIREGGTDRVLLESPGNMGGLVIDGEQAIVIRNSSNGESILAIDLKDGKKHSLFDGAIDNAGFQLTLAVDSTHVYWVKSTAGAGVLGSEIWKRARCGGAAVRIASHAFILTPKIVGDRIFFGAGDGLWSLAK